MMKLTSSQLYRSCDPETLPKTGSDALEDLADLVGQDRAREAMCFGVAIRQPGYNLFALGPAAIDMNAFLKEHLCNVATTQETPSDWCYVNNFDNPQKPRALRLPAGKAIPLRDSLRKLIEELRITLPAAFESEDYRTRREVVDAQFKERGEQGFNDLQRRAEERNIALVRTPTGLALAPMRENEVLSQEDFRKLSDPEKETIKSDIETLQKELEAIVSKVPEWERQHREAVKKLNRDVTQFAVGHLIDELRSNYPDLENVLRYLQEVEQDILENAHEFLSSATRGGATTVEKENAPALEMAIFRRYQVNVIVGNDKDAQAPVIYEDNPTHQALVGRIEHLARFGALVTDFNLLRAGALHRANGGYLMIDAQKLLSSPFAWQSLKRALRSQEIRMSSLEEMLTIASTVSLEPEPIPLDVKVILIGDPQLYYALVALDPDFADLFKVAVDFEHEIDWTDSNINLYARMIATLVRRHKLRPFNRDAMARVIERMSRLVGDSEKLSARTRGLINLLMESDHCAASDGADRVIAGYVDTAIHAQIRRKDRIHQRVQEEILRGNIRIETEGEKIGQVNGLSVMALGDYAFGQPSRITARVRLGKGEVIDIEREVALGGPLHSKGVLILSGFIGGRYEAERPLALRASLVFEQSYGGVDGDSASLAELCALLSALAEVPVKQSFAMTGSVDQNGQVQAIGGVNEKIEGFFDICQERGLNGAQGVIIPMSNVKHLMLRADVIAAVDAGKFQIHAIDHVDEAVEILMGLKAGALGKDRTYPEGTLNQRVAAKLASLAEKAALFAGMREGPRNVY